MSLFPVKIGDEVVVIAGANKVGNQNDKASSGKITSINRTKNTVTVEGVNLKKKAVRPSDDRPEGGFLEIEGPLHVSNVMKTDVYEAKKAKRA